MRCQILFSGKKEEKYDPFVLNIPVDDKIKVADVSYD